MSMELIELSNALAKATDHTAASVVAIHSEARGSSSGVIWRDGVIVTAEHPPLLPAAILPLISRS